MTLFDNLEILVSWLPDFLSNFIFAFVFAFVVGSFINFVKGWLKR